MARIVLSTVFLILLLTCPTLSSAEEETESSMFEEVAKMMLTQFSAYLAPKKAGNSDGNVGIVSKTTSSSSITTTSAPPPLTDNVRQCTCTEADECIAEAFRSFSSCRFSCRSHLDFFGIETNEYVSCFPKSPTAAISLNYCLKDSAAGYCAADASRLSFISKPNYDREFSSSGIDLQKLASLAALEHLKSFQYCADVCLKQNMLACFEKKFCGIQLPESHDLADFASFCPAFESSAYSNTMKALPCFAFKQFFSKFFN